jgi:hypothetical protein
MINAVEVDSEYILDQLRKVLSSANSAQKSEENRLYYVNGVQTRVKDLIALLEPLAKGAAGKGAGK